jgi:hypothetical protein
MLLAICILVSITPATVSGQQRKTVYCKSETFAALKPLPELTYQCPADLTDDYDDRILKIPERIKALNRLMHQLESFTDARWWNSSVSDLNACYLRGQQGKLNEDETEQFTSPTYQARLLGSDRIRLVLVSDPCYQTSYNGSDAFLLYRNGPKVYVTQVLDGHYSRAERSVYLYLFRSKSDQAVEIETMNISGMRPDSTRHYFIIDKTTHKAVPGKGLKRKKNTNIYWSERAVQ